MLGLGRWIDLAKKKKKNAGRTLARPGSAASKRIRSTRASHFLRFLRWEIRSEAHASRQAAAVGDRVRLAAGAVARALGAADDVENLSHIWAVAPALVGWRCETTDEASSTRSHHGRG